MTMTWKQHVVVLSPSGGLWMRQHKRGGCLMMMWALQHYISIALYHPGSSDGLFALCLCLSVCFCVLAVTTQVQMLRASLSEASGLTLYIMLATCYFVPWIYLLPDNLTFYIHMAAINVSKFFYLIFFRYPYYGYQNIMWDYLELNIFMAQNKISLKGK